MATATGIHKFELLKVGVTSNIDCTALFLAVFAVNDERLFSVFPDPFQKSIFFVINPQPIQQVPDLRSKNIIVVFEKGAEFLDVVFGVSTKGICIYFAG